MPDVKIDKAALHRALVLLLEEHRDKLAAAQRLTVEGVTHEDAKAEGDKDMRATEASYIARGQAMRVEQLGADHGRVHGMKLRAFAPADPIGISALVTLEGEEGVRVLFLAPAGGGERITVSGVEVHVVTPSSPLGRALVGARAGDVVTFPRGGREDEATVLAVE